MAGKFDLPPKLESGSMAMVASDDADVRGIVEYNARDSDLHAWLCKNMMMCERLCTMAGLSRSTMGDAIANNTAVMMFCLQQSLALSRGMVLDLSGNSSITDDAKYGGSFVVTLRAGLYTGIVMLDGNSLYGSIMKHLQIYVDRCMSLSTLDLLADKMSMPMPNNVRDVDKVGVVWSRRRIS